MTGSCQRSNTDPEDSDLMLAYARGDTAAFESLYTRYGLTLYRFVLRSCGNEAVASELHQEIWLRVIKARSSYNSAAPFKAWLYRIARNQLTDHYRRQGRIDTHESSADPDFPDQGVSPWISQPLTPETVAALNEQSALLDQALQSLPGTQRDVLLLRHVAGMSVAEMAVVMNQKVETIKSRLRYGTARLRSYLRESV